MSLRLDTDVQSPEPVSGDGSDRFRYRCPECGSKAFSAGYDLLCPAEGRRITGKGGVLPLMRAERIESKAPFLDGYRRIRRIEGWGGAPDYYRGLPFSSDGRHREVWKLRARSYRRGPIALTDRALGWLSDQPWPGNIRQLKQTIERAVLVLEGDRLDAADLLALSGLEARETRGGASALPSPGTMTLDEMEKAMIVKCMRHYEGNITRVAEALGLSRAALYRRFEKYGLDPHA